jgi:hypothetical protein
MPQIATNSTETLASPSVTYGMDWPASQKHVWNSFPEHQVYPQTRHGEACQGLYEKKANVFCGAKNGISLFPFPRMELLDFSQSLYQDAGVPLLFLLLSKGDNCAGEKEAGNVQALLGCPPLG